MPSVTRAPARTRARRDAVERQVVRAVEALLAEGEAFTTLGVGRIADRAGVARSSFYVHFPDKTALLLRATASATDALFEAAAAWIGDADAGRDALQATLERMVAEYRRHAVLLAAFNEVAGYDPDVAAYWRTRIEQYVGLLARRIGDRRRAAFIVWGTERTVAQHVATRRRGDRALAEALADAIWILVAP